MQRFSNVNGDMMKRLFAISLLTYLYTVNFVYGDGMYVSDHYTHLYEPSQKAVISWNGKRETMILSAAVKSEDLANFAWVIPIQSRSKPSVSAGDIRVFKDLVDYFKKPESSERKSIAPKAAIEGVQVLETKEIDIYDITILKATDAADLLGWLNANGYMVAKGAKTIFEKYITIGNCYFIANKIDLKNKYRHDIHRVEKIFADHERRYQRLCDDIDAELRKHGLQDKLYQRHQYYSTCDICGIIQDAINSPENPLNLPIRFSTVLGQNLTVKERFGAYIAISFEHGRKPKRLIIRPSVKDQHAILVYRSGQFVDAINYESYEQNPGGLRRYYDDWLTKKKLRERRRFSENEIKLLEIYLDIRKTDSVSPETKKVFYAKLEKFANELDAALGTKIFDHNRLKNDLYRDAFIYTLKSSRNQSKKEQHRKSVIPLAAKISAVYGRLKVLPRAKTGDLYDTTIALRRGMATPLKFEFEPTQPFYPLHISSLNRGKSLIEVYVISSAPVKDNNQILRVDEAKKIDSGLRRKLARQIGMSNAEYVTRLSYRGALRKLSADAVFQANGEEVSGQ